MADTIHMHIRAVGAGPAGLAAAGPIFAQLTRAKMPLPLAVLIGGPR